MKAFAKILLGAFALFMVFSVAQEWDFFSSAWFGKEQKAAGMSEEDRRGASEAVGLFLRMTCHLYGTGGDPRFAERIPASPPLVEELLADIAFLRHRHRLQEPRLMRLEVLGVEPAGEDRAEVSTREYWVARTLWMDGSAEAGPTRSDIVRCTYRVFKDGAAWKVWAWEPVEDPLAGGGAPDGGPVRGAAGDAKP